MLSNEIFQLLSQLRSRIRLYVVADLVAWVLTSIGLLLCLSLLVDYSLEMRWTFRAVLLGVFGVATLVCLVAGLASRLMSPLGQSSLALAVERLVPELSDRLITAVELESADREGLDEFSPTLIKETVESAVEAVRSIEPGQLLDRQRLKNNILLAAAVCVSWLVFVVVAPGPAKTWFMRNILLDPLEEWPHRTSLTVTGFDGGEVRIARGDDFVVRVNVDREIPHKIQIRYRMEKSRTRGRGYLKQTGEAEFIYHFQGLLEPLSFTVRGGDDYEGPFNIVTVPPPGLLNLQIACRYPEYTRLPAKTFASNALVYSLPYGTHVKLSGESNKELSKVVITIGPDEKEIVPENPREFTIDLDLEADTNLHLSLHDRDGIRNRDALVLNFIATPDLPPEIEATLQGIRPSITSQAIIPLKGVIRDEYGISRAGFRFQIDENEKQFKPLSEQTRDRREIPIEEQFDVEPFKLDPGQKLRLTVVADDRDSFKGPKTGASRTFNFSIVTKDELLSKIASRELNLRRRFERSLSEVRQAQDDLVLIQKSHQDPKTDLAMLKLYNEKTRLAVHKNLNEVAGVSQAFHEILSELNNNRIDLPNLLQRVEEGVCIPLVDITTNGFPNLEIEVDRLGEYLEQGKGIDAGSEHAVLAAGILVAKMEKVLSAMMNLESFNEAIDLLRSILTLQGRIQKDTKELRKQKIFELLR